MLIASIWLTSCTTTQINKHAVPSVVPPDPYDDNGVLIWQDIEAGQTFTADEDGVFMPFWYFRKMFDYIIDSQAALEIANSVE